MYNLAEDDNCFCMSGKKYKNCCKGGNLIFEASNGMWLKIDNEYYLKNLMKVSKFKNFYNEAFRNLNRKIYFAIGLDIKSNKSTRVFEYNGEKYYVVLTKTKQAKKNEMFEVMHEIQHFLCSTEGFPTLDYDYSGSTYPATLINIVADPIVNKRLIKKKINMQDYYKLGYDFHYNIINGYKNNGDIEEKLWTIFVTVEKIIDGELVGIQRENNKIYILVKGKYPELINDIEELYNYIISTEYDDPKNVENIYKYIIKKYNLQDKIKITYF